MEGIHNPFSRVIVLGTATPKTSGGSLDLGDGQIGLFSDKKSSRGAVAVSTLQNAKNQKFFLEVGTGITGNDGGMTSKGMRTVLFSPKDVLDLSYEQAKPLTTAKVYLGYDGVDATKTLPLKAGEAAEITLELTGAQLSYYGFKNGKLTQKFVVKEESGDDCNELDPCETTSCKDRTLKLVEQMKKREVREGVTLDDIVKIRPIFSCADGYDGATETYSFYTLTLTDEGDDAALGDVQAQVSGSKVVRLSRTGTTSVYQIMTQAAPDDYVVWAANIKTDCEGECPEGYTASDAGYLYTISLGTAAGIEAALEGKAYIDTAVKTGQEHNVDKYTILAPAVLTSGNIADLISSFPTIQIDEAYEQVTSVCIKDTNEEIAWVEGEDCTARVATYYIDLDDTDCGASRLSELQAAYPELDIYIVGGISAVDTPVAGAFTTGTYNAVSGTTDGDGTGATFNVVVTGDNSAAITVVNAGSGYKVGDTITISDADLGDGGEDDLEIVVTAIANGFAGECRQRYFTEVITNVVCDECHPDFYSSEAPASFEFSEWTKVTVAEEEGDCSCGIVFEGKDLDICPPKLLNDQIGTLKAQIEINVSGGELLGDKIGYPYKTDGSFPVTRARRAFDGTGWGKDYLDQERISYDYFLGVKAGATQAERWLKNTSSKLDTCTQYDTITVKVSRTIPSQGFSQTLTENIRYIFVIPQGSAQTYKDFFNKVASGNVDVVNL